MAERYIQAESDNIYNLTEEETINFKNNKKCHICKKKLNKIPDSLKLELDEIIKKIHNLKIFESEKNKKIIDILTLKGKNLLNSRKKKICLILKII